ncbi:MAG: hydrogenase maturation protease [Chthonomonadetes bacterium]|nr:hydrogenase maturation protease [Chthonomonadetes bacterium]
MHRTLLIGIGNVYRRDDGVGIVAVRRARPLLPPSVEVLEWTGDLMTLLEIWQGSRCVVVDALRSGGTPGEILRMEAHREPLPVEGRFSCTHSIGLEEVIALAHVLNKLPLELIVYGIEGDDFGEGEGLSLEVEKAVDDVVRYILQDVLKDGTDA